jgi:lambda family phage tail tape measure protein
MANNIEIDVQVKGVNDLKAVNDELARSGKMAEFAGDNYDELSNATLRMVQAQKSQTSMQKEIGRQLKAGTIDQAQATRALEAHDKKLQQNIATDKELIRQSKEAIKIEVRRAADATKAEKTLQSNLRLYDKERAAQEAKAQAILDINQLRNTNNVTEERHAQLIANVTAEYDLFDKGLARSGNQFARFNESTYVAQQKLKRFASVGLQQAGYQVNDFIVQVSSGQNALVAFGQQGSQLAGIFGTGGAVAGAVIAGAAALANLAYQAWKAKQDIKDLKDALDDLKEAYGTAKSATDLFSDAMEIPGFAKANLQLKEYTERLSNMADKELSVSITAAMESIKKDFDLQSVVNELFKQLTVDKEYVSSFLTPEEVKAKESEIQRLAELQILFDNLGKSGSKNFVANVIAAENALGNSGHLTDKIHKTFLKLIQDSGMLNDYIEARAEAAKAINDKAVDNAKIEADAALAKQAADKEAADREAEFRRIGLEGQAKLDAKVKQMANDAAKNYLAKKAAQKQILDDLMIENSLAAEANASGADSLKYLQLKNRFDRESLVARLDELKVFGPLRDNIIAAAEESYKLAEESWKSADGLEKAKDAAATLKKELADAAREAATLNKLLSKDDQSLAELRAKVIALRGGGSKEDANVAGAVAGRALELQAGGVDPKSAVYAQELKDAAEAEALKAEIARRTKTESGSSSKKDPIAELKAEQAQRQALLPLYGEERDYLETKYAVLGKLGESAATLSNQELEGIIQTNLALDKQDQIRKTLLDLSNTIASSFADSFMSIVDGTSSVKDAFRSMALDIVKHLYKVLVIQQMINAIGGAMAGSSNATVANIGGGLGSYKAANGAAFSGGNVIPFASGGVVGSPTNFAMSGGRTGLMGEAGPEAIMPLKRGADGKLGVSTTGGSQSITVNQVINVSTGVQQTVRAEIMGMMPQIAAASKSAVLDAKRRGGSFGGSFR